MKIINEGIIKLKVPKAEKISKRMGVFYNPVMSLNRDISILLLNSINKSNLQIADPLAATGVRSIRFLKESNNNKIKKIYINDYGKKAIELIKQNLTLNKIRYKNNEKVTICNEDANLFLLTSTGFDYIDIDPFGTPNPFLDAACKRIARDGILAVTATDTSALCGTFPRACLRKYWALPRKNAIMHETGLRILIRKIQLVAAQYDKALTPVFSYSKEHYMRVFLKNEKGKNKVDEILKGHNLFDNAGPMWMGRLWDNKLLSMMYKNVLKNKILNKNMELIKFLKAIKEESEIDAVGFYDLHDICEKNKIKMMQKKEIIKNKIKKLGYKVSDTHFKGVAIRSNIPIDKLVRILKISN
ncbi:MAG: tRNA (guanine(26)-N(2))-dimethyltransferase [Nanoarchaeota archaeon]|nr:tRNA (guanine(26)-N(2))-dimethyltransferase [Nanoarchaeota archaeon]